VAGVFITGSSDGLGLMAARLLIEKGHAVVLHGRNDARSRYALAAATGARGAVSGDLSAIAGATAVADAVNKLGRFDAVIHNAGVGYRQTRRVETEPGVPAMFAVNVLAPYILTALIERPDRLVYVSSGTHQACDRGWTICFGPSELGAAFRLTPRASFAMFYSPLPSLAAGRTSNPTRWNLDGCQPRWAALQPRTIFSKGVSPRPGSPRATTNWRNQQQIISIISAFRPEPDRERHPGPGGAIRRLPPDLRHSA